LNCSLGKEGLKLFSRAPDVFDSGHLAGGRLIFYVSKVPFAGVSLEALWLWRSQNGTRKKEKRSLGKKR
jgi:hypothetical protein